MTQTRTGRKIRRDGFIVGTLVAGAMLLAWRIPRGTGVEGLDLSVFVNPTGELQLIPGGPAFHATAMTAGPPGQGIGGAFVVRNRTGTSLAIRIQALPSSADLDDVLQVRLEAGGAELFSGRLGALRRWTAKAMILASGASETLVVHAWLPFGATGYQGGEEDVTLVFQCASVGG